MSDKALSIVGHLEELRKRLVISVVAVVAGTIVCGFFGNTLLDWLIWPLTSSNGKSSLIYTAPVDGFMAVMKLSILAGTILVSPIVLNQLWGFVAPALFPHEKKQIIPIVLWSIILFALGTAFCWYLFPQLFLLLSSYGQGRLTPLYSVTEYVNFILRLSIAFGCAFQLPVVTHALSLAGVVTSKMLISGGRYAIVAIFIAAAILTPPDVVSQILLAVPLLILYVVSIVLARISEMRKK